MQKRFHFLKSNHPNNGLLFRIVNILYWYCNNLNVSEGKISAGLIISFAGSIHLGRDETSSCKLGCLQRVSLPTPIPAWTPCVPRTVQSISLAVPQGPCATAVFLPYSYSEYCVCFHSFVSPSELTKGNVPCDFSHSEPNDNSFVAPFCRSAFLNSDLKSLKTTSDSTKLFIRGSFCPFILLLFFMLPAF